MVIFLELWMLADGINQESSVVCIDINLSKANDLLHGQYKWRISENRPK